MRRIDKQEVVEMLLIPWYSILHGFDILRNGILDICESVRQSFQRGPKDELGNYWKDIVNYADQRLGIRWGKRKTKRRRSQISSIAADEPKGELAIYWSEIVQYIYKRFGIRLGKKKNQRRSSQVASSEELVEKIK